MVINHLVGKVVEISVLSLVELTYSVCIIIIFVVLLMVYIAQNFDGISICIQWQKSFAEKLADNINLVMRRDSTFY